MAKFIEYKSKPWWTTLFMYCWSGVIVLLAVILFMRGVVSTIGFVVILACGYDVLILLYGLGERRYRIETEVASGKLPKHPSKTVDHTFLEFREDPVRRATLLMYSIIMGLFVLVSFATTYWTKRAGAAVGSNLVPFAVLLLLLAVVWATSKRLRIEGDEVQVTYPFLGGWGNGSFRFGEIASVEVRNSGRGGNQVCIGLHDGSFVRYTTWNETVIDELVGALKRGVA
jgi:hypothetical protein